MQIFLPDAYATDYAISDKTGTVDFYQINSGDAGWDGVSGLLDRPDLYNQEFTNTKVIKVNSITGSELLNTIDRDIDLCKIDVEGASYEVLQGFGNAIEDIKLIQIEAEQKVIWNDQKTFKEVYVLLREKGFEKIWEVALGTTQLDSIWVRR